MLHFDERISLFRTITQQDGHNEQHKTKKPPAVYVVGQEKNDVYLVARDDIHLNRSYIEMIDKEKRVILYENDTLFKCVSASINQDATILAYTTFRFRDEEDKEGLYESFLVEVDRNEMNNRFLFNIRGPQFQCIQFIHDPQQSKKNQTFFLFFRDKERIEMYNICTEKRKGITTIVAQPELQTTFVKKYLWAQWDPQNSLLFYIVQHQLKDQSPRLNDATTVTIDVSLKCCSFKELKRPSIVFDSILPIEVPAAILKENYRPNYDKFPWKNGHCSPDQNISFQIIRLSDHTVCLCQQHTVQNTPGIGITVFALHHKTRISFTIPMNSCEWKSPPKVFFGVLYGMLIIYLPGKFLQFLDCGRDHAPWVSLQFNGPEEVPHLPHFNPKKENSETKQSSEMVIPLQSSFITNESNGGVMLNLRKGFVYEYKLSFENFEKWFSEQKSTRVFVQAFHMACVHIKDGNLVKSLMRTLCSKLDKFTTSEVFIEYLYGMSFVRAKKKVDSDFLRCIPLSVQEKSPYRVRGFIQIKLPGIYQQRNLANVRSPPRITLVDRVRETCINYSRKQIEKEQQQLLQSQIQRRASMKSFFGFNLFGSKKEIVPMDINQFSFTTAWKRQYNERLREQIILQFQGREIVKQKVPIWSHNYTEIAAGATESLFDIIRKSTTENGYSKSYFHLLENFYGALEETAFPPPADFITHFTEVGYEILPPKTFIQYLNRNIFYITEDIIRRAMNNNMDPSFISLLLRRLEEKEKEVLLHEEIVKPNPHLIEYYHNFIPHDLIPPNKLLYLYTKMVEQNKNVEDGMRFAPFDFFSLSLDLGLKLQKNFTHEHEYIKRNAPIQFCKIFKDVK